MNWEEIFSGQLQKFWHKEAIIMEGGMDGRTFVKERDPAWGIETVCRLVSAEDGEVNDTPVLWIQMAGITFLIPFIWALGKKKEEGEEACFWKKKKKHVCG